MATVETQFINMISLKQEELAQLNAKMEKLSHDQLDAKIEKYIDIHQEYMMTQNTDYSQDYREIDADWSMTSGEKDDAYEKIEELVDYQHEHGLEIENEMSAILTKEFMPPYPVSDLDIQQDGDLYYVGRQININGEWTPYTNDSNQMYDNKDEAIKMFANMKVDQISNNIGIDLPPIVPYNNPILMNEGEIERKIFGETFDIKGIEQNLEIGETSHDEINAFTVAEQDNKLEISDLRVMESGNGFYIGRLQYDQDFGWTPYNRISDYMPDKENAKELLEKCEGFKDMIKDMKPGFIESVKENLMDEIESDPYQINLKVNLINDSLEHDMEKTIEQTIIEIER